MSRQEMNKALGTMPKLFDKSAPPTWKTRMAKLKLLGQIVNTLCQSDDATAKKEVQNQLSQLHIIYGLCKQLRDLRSAVVKVACRVVSAIASSLGRYFDPFSGKILSTLIPLTVTPHPLVVRNSASGALNAVLECTDKGLSYAMPKILATCTTKSNPKLRCRATDVLLTVLKTWDITVLKDDSLVPTVAHTISDALPETRERGRECLEVLSTRIPESASEILEKLSPRTRRTIKRDSSASAVSEISAQNLDAELANVENDDDSQLDISTVVEEVPADSKELDMEVQALEAELEAARAEEEKLAEEAEKMDDEEDEIDEELKTLEAELAAAKEEEARCTIEGMNLEAALVEDEVVEDEEEMNLEAELAEVEEKEEINLEAELAEVQDKEEMIEAQERKEMNLEAELAEVQEKEEMTETQEKEEMNLEAELAEVQEKEEMTEAQEKKEMNLEAELAEVQEEEEMTETQEKKEMNLEAELAEVQEKEEMTETQEKEEMNLEAELAEAKKQTDIVENMEVEEEEVDSEDDIATASEEEEEEEEKTQAAEEEIVHESPESMEETAKTVASPVLSPTQRQMRVMDVAEEFIPQVPSGKQDVAQVKKKDEEFEDLAADIPVETEDLAADIPIEKNEVEDLAADIPINTTEEVEDLAADISIEKKVEKENVEKKQEKTSRKRKSPTRPSEEPSMKKSRTPMTWKKLLAPDSKVSLISQTQFLIKAYRKKCEHLRVVQRAYDRTLKNLAELKENNVAMKDAIRRQTEDLEDCI
jgi:hypothetical protein